MHLQELENILINCLLEAKIVHDSLGDHRTEKIKNNRYGDMALLVDVACEEAVISCLQKNNIPLRMYSEEHPVTDTASSPIYTGVMDGIDGTSKIPEGGRYSTMFAIYDGLNPSYDDYLVCGMLEHVAENLFFCVKGKGAFVIELVSGSKTPIKVSSRRNLTVGTKIYIDEYWEFNRKHFSSKVQSFKIPGRDFCTMSSTIYYADLISGNTDLVLDCSHKGNLEIGVSYGLVREAKGVVVDMRGESVGSQKFLSYGQESTKGFVSASTKELADALLLYIQI